MFFDRVSAVASHHVSFFKLLLGALALAVSLFAVVVDILLRWIVFRATKKHPVVPLDSIPDHIVRHAELVAGLANGDLFVPMSHVRPDLKCRNKIIPWDTCLVIVSHEEIPTPLLCHLSSFCGPMPLSRFG
jgi:hypothetical protein